MLPVDAEAQSMKSLKPFHALNEKIILQIPKKSQFEDVFGESSSNNFHECRNSSHTGAIPFVSEKKDVYVSNSFFHNCTCSENGGAILCKSSVNRLLIEETSFVSCKTTSTSGGGIYFSNDKNGQFVIFRTCGFDCSSMYSGTQSTYGQFVLTETKNDAVYKNEVRESTFASCKNESESPYYAVSLYYSNIICSSVNISNNECCYQPALRFYPSLNKGGVTCSMMFTSIVNNTAKGGYGCIFLSKESSEQLIDTCNIINNRQSITYSDGTISTYGNLFINNSCIIGNNEGNKVFSEKIESCQIKIKNCTHDKDIITKARYSGSITFEMSNEVAFTHALSHFVTGKCISKGNKNHATHFNKKARNNTLCLFEYVFLVSLLPSKSKKEI